MKKCLILIMCFVCALSVLAQDTTAELVIRMNNAQRDGDYLEALVAASAILKQNSNHRIAKDFVHNYYQRMDAQAKSRISEIAFSEDAAELEEIALIYRQLTEINDNLSEVEMPLSGGNKLTGEWVWQPELQYYQGHYDRARMNVFDMYKRIAKAAVKENNMDAAYTYYQKALNTFLLSEEYASQLEDVIGQCAEMADIDAKSLKTDDLLRAYNTYGLIYQLDNKQKEAVDKQHKLMPEIAKGYVNDSRKLQSSSLVTDWELAYDYLQTAIDWSESIAPKIGEETNALKDKIIKYYEQENNQDQLRKWRQ